MQMWHFVDKMAWTDGPWKTEPDKVQWTDAATGLPCLAVRNRIGGYWCGYVGVSEGHPFFGVPYSLCPDICGKVWCGHSPESLLSVHGRITYSDFCREEDQPYGVCHIPEPGQDDHVFWFGFDCAHCGDMMPGVGAHLPSLLIGEYRAIEYIQSECAKLAAQLFPMLYETVIGHVPRRLEAGSGTASP